MRRLTTALASLALVASTACAAASGGSRGASIDRNVITAEEIQGSSASNAYDLVARLRPQYLRGHGTIVTGGMTSRNDAGSAQQGQLSGTVQVAVYLDDTLLGTPDALKQVEISAIQEIRYYSAADATTKWGTGNSAGAIQVIMRRQ